MTPAHRGSMLDRAFASRWQIARFVGAVGLGTWLVSRLAVGVALDQAGAVGQELAAALPAEAAPIARRPALHTDAHDVVPLPAATARVDATASAAPAPRGAAATGAGARAVEIAKPRGFLIRERAVLAAIARGARPSAQVVAATNDLPGGLRLSGVPAPFREGDVLVAVGGTPARSEDAIVSAVLGAVKSGARTITGEILRRASPGADASSTSAGAVERIPFAVEVPERFWKARALPGK